MTEDKHAPEQDASEGDRATVERELERTPGTGTGSVKKPDMPNDGPRGGEKVAIATPVEPGDQNAQSMPPSM